MRAQMNLIKRTSWTVVLLVSLFILGCFITVLPFDNVFMLQHWSSLYYLTCGIALTIYFSDCVLDEKLRRYLVCIGLLIVMWFVLRISKYAVFQEQDTFQRYLWYMYYIPTLLIPQLSLESALIVGRGQRNSNAIDEYPRNKVFSIGLLTRTLTYVFILIVLTNDIHQWVFAFNPGFVNYDSDYTHGLLFWIIMGYDYALLITSAVVLLRKCRLSASRKLAWIPFIYILIFSLWSVITNLDLRPEIWGSNPGEFPETTCFMMGGMWILCICIGLVPSSRGYNLIVEEINRIGRELRDIIDALSEENVLLEHENDIRTKQARAEEKSRLYDSIADKVYVQSHRIEELVADAENYPELYEINIRIMCIYAAYIKRVTNLMLLASNNKELRISELGLAVQESMRYMSKMGLLTEFNGSLCDGNVQIPARRLIAAYDAFNSIVEKSFRGLRGMFTVLNDDSLKLTFEYESTFSAAVIDACDDRNNVDSLSLSGIRVEVERDEDIGFVTIYFNEEGGAE